MKHSLGRPYRQFLTSHRALALAASSLLDASGAQHTTGTEAAGLLGGSATPSHHMDLKLQWFPVCLVSCQFPARKHKAVGDLSIKTRGMCAIQSEEITKVCKGNKRNM